MLSEPMTRGRVSQTEDRAALWRPDPVFRFYHCAWHWTRPARRVAFPDGSQAVEWLGHQPRLVRGNVRNIKVTGPEDLALAEFMLSPE
jgi:2-C-methyl-D-erythritol 4-phosphate cytidylyltransferase